MTVCDTIKNGIASKGDPFKQFNGVGFEQSSLAKLSPLRMSGVIDIAHILLLIERRRVRVKSFRFSTLARFICNRLHVCHIEWDAKRVECSGRSGQASLHNHESRGTARSTTFD